MENQQKPRVITDYEKLDNALIEQIKLEYPYGYSQNLISFTNREGNQIKGLRFETDEKIYLIRMSFGQAEKIISDDDDYDIDGNLIESIKDEYEDKHGDSDEDED